MHATVVLPCNCTHEFQDKTYGKGLRLHNVDTTQKKKPSDCQAYCTVCCPPSKDKQKEDILPNLAFGVKNTFKKRAPRIGKSIKN